MHYLQNFKYNEIIRGILNKGNFRLKPIHQNASLDPEDVEMLKEVCDPLKIIELVNGDIYALLLEEDRTRTADIAMPEQTKKSLSIIRNL